ncbi:hypothetical protein Tco_0307704 [Tanacetum coccineum]
MVGEYSSRIKAWDDVILKLRSRLSKWKVKTLSIGGRLTLLKSVLGASPIYNMSIFKVPTGVLKVMESIRSRFFNGDRWVVIGFSGWYTSGLWSIVLCTVIVLTLITEAFNLVESICPVCSGGVVVVGLFLVRCDLAQLVLRRICRWWGLDPHDWSSFQEWQSWILSIQFSSKGVADNIKGHSRFSRFHKCCFAVQNGRMVECEIDSPQQPLFLRLRQGICGCVFAWDVQKMSSGLANVGVRMMEENDVKVLYDAWKRIYAIKYVHVDRPPPQAKGTSAYVLAAALALGGVNCIEVDGEYIGDGATYPIVAYHVRIEGDGVGGSCLRLSRPALKSLASSWFCFKTTKIWLKSTSCNEARYPTLEGEVNKGSDEESSDVGSLRVIVYEYDGLLMHPVAPPSPDYVPRPEHPPSPNYVLDPKHPPSPVYVPYVTEPEYPEYLVPSDAEEPMEDQPLTEDAS